MAMRPSRPWRIVRRFGSAPRSRLYPFGGWMTSTAKPSLMPSFSASGFADEPAGIGGGQPPPPPPLAFFRARRGRGAGALFPSLGARNALSVAERFSFFPGGPPPFRVSRALLLPV